MATQQEFQFNKINPFVLLIGFVIILVVLFTLAKGFFNLISWASPVIFLAALVINYRVVLGYGKWLLGLLRSNLIMGIIAGAFSIFAFPLVSFFLLINAIGSKKLQQMMTPKVEEFTDYEEVNENDYLNLDDLNKTAEKIDKQYKDLI